MLRLAAHLPGDRQYLAGFFEVKRQQQGFFEVLPDHDRAVSLLQERAAGPERPRNVARPVFRLGLAGAGISRNLAMERRAVVMDRTEFFIQRTEGNRVRRMGVDDGADVGPRRVDRRMRLVVLQRGAGLIDLNILDGDSASGS